MRPVAMGPLTTRRNQGLFYIKGMRTNHPCRFILRRIRRRQLDPDGTREFSCPQGNRDDGFLRPAAVPITTETLPCGTRLPHATCFPQAPIHGGKR